MNNFRRMRHWKQRFEPGAKFIWAKPVKWEGKECQPGDEIPADLANNRNRLRRFWESRFIELGKFDAPNVATGVVSEPAPKAKEEEPPKEYRMERRIPRRKKED